MAEKHAIKGLSKVSLFPITTNSTEAYAVGEKISLPWAKSLTKSPETSETKEFADDTLYAVDSEFTGESFTLTVAELTTELMAQLEGGEYNEETREYTFSNTTTAPEIAMTFRALKKNGQYRMFRYYRATVSSVAVDLNTKGDSTGTSNYVITGMFMPRAVDGAIRTNLDGESDADNTWVDTIPAVTL